jgi:hypothetical protein
MVLMGSFLQRGLRSYRECNFLPAQVKDRVGEPWSTYLDCRSYCRLARANVRPATGKVFQGATEPEIVSVRQIWGSSTKRDGPWMPLSPETLTANAEVLERLSWTFELRVTTDDREPVWFSVDGGEGIRRIARNGAGGVFALISGSPRVL